MVSTVSGRSATHPPLTRASEFSVVRCLSGHWLPAPLLPFSLAAYGFRVFGTGPVRAAGYPAIRLSSPALGPTLASSPVRLWFRLPAGNSSRSRSPIGHHALLRSFPALQHAQRTPSRSSTGFASPGYGPAPGFRPSRGFSRRPPSRHFPYGGAHGLVAFRAFPFHPGGCPSRAPTSPAVSPRNECGSRLQRPVPWRKVVHRAPKSISSSTKVRALLAFPS